MHSEEAQLVGRTLADRTGEEWEAFQGWSVTTAGSPPFRASSTIRFRNRRTGFELRAEAAKPLDELADCELIELLEGALHQNVHGLAEGR